MIRCLVFICFWLLSPAGQAAEPARVLPSSQAQIQLSYAPVVKEAAPAVVNIYTTKIVQQRALSPFMNDPFFQYFFGGAFPGGMDRQRFENSLGSGVIVKPDGLIVTSNHVIDGADEIKVVLADRREYEAKLVSSDERSDVAVLRINPRGEALPFLKLKDSDEIEVGDMVLAIGNPFGVGQTVTSGIISALARTTLDINDINYYIQTDAAINPGNSGGALVTMDGKLIGINTAIYTRDGGNMGLGFAVPANMVRAVIASVETGGKKIARPWTGIEGQPVTADVARSIGLAKPSGLLINALHEASPARQAGIKIGDVILGVGGKRIEDPAAYAYRIATLAPGAEVEVEIFRGGQTFKRPLKLIAPPEVPAREETLIEGPSPLNGATLANLSPAVAADYGLRGMVDKGVAIVAFKPGAAALRLGLGKGDVLMEVNGTKIETVQQAKKALKEPKGRGWHLIVNRDGNKLSLFVGG